MAFLVLVLMPSLVITWAIYWAYNTWSEDSVERAWQAGLLPEYQNLTRPSQMADRAIERRWADPKLYRWLCEVLAPPSTSFPASAQALALFEARGDNAPSADERRQRLHRRVSGDRQPSAIVDWSFLPPWVKKGFPITIHVPLASDVFSEQAGLNDSVWQKVVETADPKLADEKKKFVLRYLQALLDMTNTPLRRMYTLNGWIQWLTIFLTGALVITSFRRWLLVSKLAISASKAKATPIDTNPDGASPLRIHPRSSEIAMIFKPLRKPPPTPQAIQQARGELKQLAQSADTTVYGLLSTFAATIPALGFLGTVYGMGEALLRADGLFSAADKQRVIGLITQDLGSAFDTTLVALICSPIALVILASVRSAEQLMYLKWETVLELLAVQVGASHAN